MECLTRSHEAPASSLISNAVMSETSVTVTDIRPPRKVFAESLALVCAECDTRLIIALLRDTIEVNDELGDQR